MHRTLLTILSAALLACGPTTPSTESESETKSESESGSDSTAGEAPADPLVDRCDPNAGLDCEGFSTDAMCCSDDPAALDLDNLATLATPNYIGRGGDGVALFSGGNNPLSRVGACVPVDSVPPASALADVGAQGCPVPCNPTWSSAVVEEVCGAGEVCCQTQPIAELDCVLDVSLGDSGCYRPVTGDDIAGVGQMSLTDWAASSHATHQDPGGTSCQLFVQAIPPMVLANNGLTEQDVLIACYLRLTVANQRGFCLGGLGLDACPIAPGTADACAQLNLDNALSGC